MTHDLLLVSSLDAVSVDVFEDIHVDGCGFLFCDGCQTYDVRLYDRPEDGRYKKIHNIITG
jgi:hypothetical protein